MTDNGGLRNGTGVYDMTRTAWEHVSAETCRDPDSDEGHWVRGLLTGVVAWRADCSPEQAEGIVGAARAAAAIIHSTEIAQRRELL
jgi:hypothetical protein